MPCCFSVGFGSSGGLRHCPGRGSMIQTFHKPRETPPRSFWKAFVTIYHFSSLILQRPLATEWLPKASLLLNRMQHGGPRCDLYRLLSQFVSRRLPAVAGGWGQKGRGIGVGEGATKGRPLVRPRTWALTRLSGPGHGGG